ncbi:MAG: hypothetical protein AAFO04_27040 [Cyanobacteria bacterium J06592_8]
MIRMTYIDLADIVYDRSRFDSINLSQPEEIASSILAVGGLVYPLIVEQIHFTAFQLIDYRDNYLQFKATLKADQIDSRQDIINCIVMSAESGTGYEHAHPKALVEKQL